QDRQSLLSDEALRNWSEPKKMEAAILLGGAEVREYGALAGWDAETTRLKVREYESATLSNVALRIAQADPIAATEFIQANSNRLMAVDMFDVLEKLAPMVQDAAT